MGNQQNQPNHARQRRAEQCPDRQQQAAQPGEQQNEGEGNRTAARAYNADQHRFAGDHGKVDEAAQSARKAVEGAEGAELTLAEIEGKKHARY